jgi:hypothetical protein
MWICERIISPNFAKASLMRGMKEHDYQSNILLKPIAPRTNFLIFETNFRTIMTKFKLLSNSSSTPTSNKLGMWEEGVVSNIAERSMLSVKKVKLHQK